MRIALIVAGALAAASVCAAEPVAEMPPLMYDTEADERCAASLKAAIDPTWIAELRGRLPEAQALWNQSARQMFAAASKAIGRTVSPPTAPVRLTLCPIPSQASKDGPIVNMRFALRSFTAEPVALRTKIDTAFHESLHAVLAQYDPARSQLLRAHRGESLCVQAHLHLLSLQKAVLLSLGQARELAQVMSVDAQLPSGCYKRAWAIIEQSPEAYLAYLRELAGGA